MAPLPPPLSGRPDPWREMMLAVAARRDRLAFAEIFDHFAPRLESSLRRQGLNAAEAEDVAQEVMTTLWVKAALFDPDKSSLATWIYRIARNRRIDLARRATRVALPLEALAEDALPADAPLPDARLEEDERDALVRGALVDLPEEQSQLVRLSYYEGLSQSEIAARHNLPMGTVKSRLRLAFGKLRLSLAARGVTNAG